jgi:uncharacterized repeat protein (TIGR03803 family)
VLHVFASGDKEDGRSPLTDLVQSRDGSLWGTTNWSTRRSRTSTIFRLSPGGAYEVMHFLTLAEGEHPSALIQADDGSFYGTALSNYPNGGGTAFRITQEGLFTVIHEFSLYGAEGFYPSGALVQERDGLLYGVASAGGSRSPEGCNGYGCGTVYRMALDGDLTVLHSFGEGTPGQIPSPSLTRTRGHRLLGMTSEEPVRKRVHVFGIAERE